MAEESEDSSDKTEEPSQHRLEEMRNKGDVAYSRELNSVLILAGTLFTVYLSMIYVFEVMSEYIQWILQVKVAKMYTEKGLAALFQRSLIVCAKAAGPALAVSFCIGFITQMVQVGFLFAPEAISAKFERVNPINGIQRLFSKKILAETVKSLFKFGIIIIISFVVIKGNLLQLPGFLHVTPLQGIVQGKEMAFRLGGFILLGLAVIGLLDFGWEKFSYFQKLKMTKQEAKQEHKEQEGSPEIKQKIRTIQREMARRKMLSKVKTANVIVTNPTHYSVALKYDTQGMVAPEVVAKGTDFMALRIRELAKDNDIPIVENIYVARTLYQVCKVGQPVPRSLYKAVAEILAFVYRLNKKKKALA